ncbi:MAG: hypothetical protein IJP16_01245 [Clostridia bacterium]|nr:hypothetical protein [Clostridia bacterium]
MKNVIRILALICFAFLSFTLLFGCEREFTPEGAIKIEDIDWRVKNAVREGERYLSLEYTNNTKYTILDLEIKYTFKDDVSDYSAFDGIKEEDELTDEEVKELYILGYNRRRADPGETVSESPLVIDGGYTLAESKHLELMRPDMAEILYVGSDGLGYLVYYDFINDEYSELQKGDGRELYEWSESELAKMVPQPDAIAVSLGWDTEESFSFNALGVTLEEYKSYVEAAREMGYTDVSYEDEDSFRADNSDGDEISVSYYDLEEEMSVFLSLD